MYYSSINFLARPSFYFWRLDFAAVLGMFFFIKQHYFKIPGTRYSAVQSMAASRRYMYVMSNLLATGRRARRRGGGGSAPL